MKGAKMMGGGTVCGCPCHKFKHLAKGVAFALVGLAFMYPAWQYALGIVLLLFGIVMLFAGFCKCCNK